jgi:hypothetical protein
MAEHLEFSSSKYRKEPLTENTELSLVPDWLAAIKDARDALLNHDGCAFKQALYGYGKGTDSTGVYINVPEYSLNFRENLIRRVANELDALRTRTNNQEIPSLVQLTNPADDSLSTKFIGPKGETLYEVDYRRDAFGRKEPPTGSAVPEILNELPQCEIS